MNHSGNDKVNAKSLSGYHLMYKQHKTASSKIVYRP